MNLIVLSPTKKRLYPEVLGLELETQAGQIEILPGHQKMVSALSIGPLTIKMTDRVETILINGGIIKVENNELEILTSHSTPSSEIIEAEIEKAILLAQKKITPQTLPTELIRIEKEIRYHQLKRQLLPNP